MPMMLSRIIPFVFFLQVPAVSDRLFLSIVSVDSGKTIAKSSKAASRSGICQWPDTILEPIWFSKDEASKEYEECQYKIIVSVVWNTCRYFATLPMPGHQVSVSISAPTFSLPYSCCRAMPLCCCQLISYHVMLQGSTKSGILGEIFLNLSNFLNLVDPTAISLPLKRCNSGTVLQVCLSYLHLFVFKGYLCVAHMIW